MSPAQLKSKAEEILTPLLRGFTKAVMLGFPNHSNVGDSAIWLGQRALLKKKGISVPATSTNRAYDAKALRKAAEGAVILLTGGGNFGDLWRQHQELRLKAVRDFPEHTLILLPNSAHFIDESYLERTKRAFNAHPRLTLMARDKTTFDFMSRHFKAPVVLCPDLAHWADVPSFSEPPSCDTLWLRRRDKEGRDREIPALPGRVEQADWVNLRLSLIEESWNLPLKAGQWLARLTPALDPQAWLVERLSRRARLALERGCRLLARGRVVVSDRLHANILAEAMGLGHVALDNSYGKVHGYYETWGLPERCRLARTNAEARALADQLLVRND